MSSISSNSVSIPRERGCLDCLSRAKSEPVETEMRGISSQYFRPRPDSPLPEPLFPLPRITETTTVKPLLPRKRSSVIRRSPSFNPHLNPNSTLHRASISMIPDINISMPPQCNPFNLPILPSRDYLLDKIKQDEDRIKINLLDKLENEITNIFFSNASNTSTVQELYTNLFQGIMEVFADNYTNLKVVG